MQKKIKWEWEALDEETSRAKVYGGWVVCHKTGTKSESMVFVPDANHGWLLQVPLKEVAKVKSIAQDF